MLFFAISVSVLGVFPPFTAANSEASSPPKKRFLIIYHPLQFRSPSSRQLLPGIQKHLAWGIA